MALQQQVDVLQSSLASAVKEMDDMRQRLAGFTDVAASAALPVLQQQVAELQAKLDERTQAANQADCAAQLLGAILDGNDDEVLHIICLLMAVWLVGCGVLVYVNAHGVWH